MDVWALGTLASVAGAPARFAVGVLSALGLILGGLLAFLVAWLSLFAFVSPECGTDPDDTAARLSQQVAFGLLIALVIVLTVGVVVALRRLPFRPRSIVAIAYPAAVVVAFIIVTGALEVIHSLMDAPGPIASCW